MGDQVTVKVECYSGSAYGERPVAVIYQGLRHEIRRVIDSNQTPNGKIFRVLMKSGEEIRLHYNQALDVWTSEGLT